MTTSKTIKSCVSKNYPPSKNKDPKLRIQVSSLASVNLQSVHSWLFSNLWCQNDPALHRSRMVQPQTPLQRSSPPKCAHNNKLHPRRKHGAIQESPSHQVGFRAPIPKRHLRPGPAFPTNEENHRGSRAVAQKNG